MFEAICLREVLACHVCHKTGPHTRAKSSLHFKQGSPIYGWACEACGSIQTDDKGPSPVRRAGVLAAIFLIHTQIGLGHT